MNPTSKSNTGNGKYVRRPRRSGMSVAPSSVLGMAKTATRPTHRCTECGWTTGRWVGRCGECQTWGSVAEAGAPQLAQVTSSVPTRKAVPIGQVSADLAIRTLTGVTELDRVLGDGLVPGAVVLLAGEPGVGKSTLLLEVASRWAQAGRRDPVRLGRGVGRPGAAAGRPDPGAGRRALPGRRDRPGHRARTHRGGPALADGAGLGADGGHGRGRRLPRRGDPGPRGHRRAGPGGQAAGHGGDHRRPRHQGRGHRRAADDGAPGRRGAELRGRPALGVPAGPGDQEPLRPGRRGRLLRDGRAGHRLGARPVGPVHLPARRAGARAPASR